MKQLYPSRSVVALLGLTLVTGARVADGQEAAEDKPAPAPAPKSSAQKRSTTLTPGSEGNPEEGGVRQIEGAAVGLIPPGGLYGVDSTAAAGDDDEGEARPGGPVPEYHVVKKGDTLWSVCDQYFRDPWQWPQLWARNPLITNPHWIFPGDVVRLHEAGAAPAAVAAAAPAPKGSPMVRSTRPGALGRNALVLREIGFVEAKDLEVAAVISGSREEKIMLSTGDQAYLTFPKDRPLKAGERYTVFVADTDHPVRAPGSNAVLGYLVRIYGDVVVDQIADSKSARGTLVDLMDPVERGYHISPLVKQFRRIEPRPSGVNLEARIVASFSPARMLSPETFVVLSRGKRDGVQIGNRTFVVRRGDGYRRIMEGWDKFDANYPHEVVGELWVVDVREDTALAWIARSTKEIRVGELTEMRKGH